MSVAELDAFLHAEFPQTFHAAAGLVIESAADGSCRLREHFRPDMLRPGGTVSGPTLMALADVALYVAVLSTVGPVALAVTTNLNFNFFRKGAAGRDLIAEARLYKRGKRLAVGEVTLFSQGMADPIAHATGTYAIPKM